MEKLELYEGRPADCTGRLEKEVHTYDLLDRLGIQFWRTDHAWMARRHHGSLQGHRRCFGRDGL